jgi:hypothetical protein
MEVNGAVAIHPDPSTGRPRSHCRYLIQEFCFRVFCARQKNLRVGCSARFSDAMAACSEWSEVIESIQHVQHERLIPSFAVGVALPLPDKTSTTVLKSHVGLPTACQRPSLGQSRRSDKVHTQSKRTRPGAMNPSIYARLMTRRRTLSL